MGMFFYNIGVNLYVFFVSVFSLWNEKAKKWIDGRADVWSKIESFKSNGSPIYWFHCASLGEFEQGRPIIESLKQKEACQIVISFFSPSGYEIRQNYELADLVVYLPKDSKANARKFLSTIQPKSIFFVKYEFWAHYIFEAQKLEIPIYSVSAIFRKKQIFFKAYGGFMRKVLKAFDAIFVQDTPSAEMLKSIGIDSIIAGDTRYDRVVENASRVEPYPLIERFIDQQKVLVVGSSWGQDEVLLKFLIDTPEFNWKVIIAPHEIHASHLNQIEGLFEKRIVRYSNLKAGCESDILLIDNIGMLMNVYQYANIAYVGGAFGKGLHNILEPASFGVPVIFGPNYDKFQEAKDFIANRIGISIHDKASLKIAFEHFKVKDLSDQVQAFMNAKTGATNIILEKI